jgi:hypothetical protein
VIVPREPCTKEMTAAFSVAKSIRPTGLVLPKDLTHEDLLEVGRHLARAKSSLQWAIGDWLIALLGPDNLPPGHLPGGKTNYDEAMEILGLKRRYLMSLRMLALRYPRNARRADLTWMHHKLAAPLAEPLRSRMLRSASENRWNLRELTRQINACGSSAKPHRNAKTITYIGHTIQVNEDVYQMLIAAAGGQTPNDFLKQILTHGYTPGASRREGT